LPSSPSELLTSTELEVANVRSEFLYSLDRAGWKHANETAPCRSFIHAVRRHGTRGDETQGGEANMRRKPEWQTESPACQHPVPSSHPAITVSSRVVSIGGVLMALNSVPNGAIRAVQRGHAFRQIRSRRHETFRCLVSAMLTETMEMLPSL
jgi:hypothetical protein